VNFGPAVLAVLTFVLLAGCQSGPQGAPSDTSLSVGSTSSAESSNTPGEAGTFPSGIYYSQPAQGQGPNVLTKIGGGLPRTFALRPNGFDLTFTIAVSTDSQSTLLLIDAQGKSTQVQVPGLFHMGRPTLSGTGKVAVQANENPDAIGSNQAGADFNIYIVDLTDGSHKRISALDVNEESPEWIPGTTVVAYSSFDPERGIDLHLYDTATSTETVVPGAGGLHVAASKDGLMLLESKRLRILDGATGAVKADLLQAALAGMRAAGYELDSAHGGMQGQGSFPLDGDFSPDGKRIVFDGAVVGQDGAGLLVMTMAIDGSGFEVVAGPVPADPARSNNHNYSQINPKWL